MLLLFSHAAPYPSAEDTQVLQKQLAQGGLEGRGSSDRAQTLCPHPDFRPNSEGGSCKQFPKSEVGSARGLHFSRAQSQSSHALSGFDRDLRAGR